MLPSSITGNLKKPWAVSLDIQIARAFTEHLEQCFDPIFQEKHVDACS